MNLEHFYFPVEEKEIALLDNQQVAGSISGYKAIVAPKTEGREEIISVVRDSYKLVPNRDLIEPFLEKVDALNVNWYIDESHSFAQSNRMRLQITFPDLYLEDEESRSPLSLYLHNSYDMSEGIRLFWGAIRAICRNGMVMGNLLGSFYARHTQGFAFNNIEHHFHQATEKMKQVDQRINQLDTIKLEESFMEQVQKTLGKRRLKAITGMESVPDQSQWELLKDITYFISHHEEKKRRADLQLKVSHLFHL